MVKSLYFWIGLLIISNLMSCNDYAVDLGEGYLLRAIDGKENMAVGYGDKRFNVAVVDQTVFEVLWNDSFVLAKRHPSKLGVTIATVDRDSVEYYIIEKITNERDNPHRKVNGPFGLKVYNEKLRQLGINENHLEKRSFDNL